MKKFLSIALMLCILSFSISVYAEIPRNTRGVNAVVVGGWLRLRSGPGYNYQTIASLPNGSIVRVISTTGEWCKIQTKDGEIGYMSRQYLNKTNLSIDFEQSSGGYDAYVYSANGGNVRLRSGPSFNYGVIGSYSFGTKLHVINHGITWDYVRIGSQLGYIKNEFITQNLSPSESNNNEKYIAFVISSNGYGVRVRSYPSINSTIIGFYSVGTSVEVLNHNYTNGWDKISVGGRVGFIMNRFLTPDTNVTIPFNNKNLIDVSLNKYSANIGEDVYVVSTNPSSANVSYKWKIDNTIISYSNGILIPNYADNKTIILEAEGINGYRGKVIKSIYVSQNQLSVQDVIVPSSANVGDTISAQTIPNNADVDYFWNYDSTLISNSSICTIPAGSEGFTVNLVVKGKGRYSGTIYKTIRVNSSPSNVPIPVPNNNNYYIQLDKSSYSVGETAVANVYGGAYNSVGFEWYIDGFCVSYMDSYTIAQEDSGKTIEIKAMIRNNQEDITISKNLTIN